MHTMPQRSTAPTSRDSYHHGNLREALVDAAVQIVEEHGLDGLSVREAARRAGVSPGAPFRHFATRAALLTAVAEQATQRLRSRVEAELAKVSKRPALERFAAIGHAYLGWAEANPTHFRIISDRLLIDYESSPSMGADNQAIRTQMAKLLREAFGAELDDTGLAQAQLAARALVYGLARMATDGHFPEWNLQHRATGRSMAGALDFFIDALSASASLKKM